MIYKLKTLYSEGLKPISFNKSPLEDYHEIIDEYMTRFEALIREIILSDKPFSQAECDDTCSFCRFKTLCRRQ
ncbi:hypothetical protein [uncultured Duncaniella sp.]